MALILIPHPDMPAPGLAIVADVERHGGSEIRLRFRVSGDVDTIRLAAPQPPQRADELWKRSCFEAFVGLPGTEAYREFNFAPSGAWAAYDFDGYRKGMRDAEVAVPKIEVSQAPDRFELVARFDLPRAAPLRLGLSAVIEQSDGARSFWALNHPPGAPDFHHRDCFALELPAARDA